MHNLRIFKLMIFMCFSIAAAQTYDLPLILINTNGDSIVKDPKIPATMYVIDGKNNSPADSLSATKYAIGIDIHGQTSSYFDKKGYGVEIKDSSGSGMNAPLLGLPEGEDWILHGPFIDKSLIRNALVHHMYRATGRYSPRTCFCELFMNNNYDGVYLLEEKIKRGKYRVDIAKLTKSDTAGDSLTGGYLFRIDKTDSINSEGFLSSNKLKFLYTYPKMDDMQPSQKIYLENTVNNFENLMKTSSWADEATGYPSVIDVDAAADYILIEEVSKNTDAYDVSFYMYKDRDSKGGKIVFGPPWDFNLAFGAVKYMSGMDTSGWEIKNASLTQSDSYTGYKIPTWMQNIFGDAVFQSRLKERWTELRSSVWHSASISKYFDSVSTVLTNASTRNFQRWKILGSATCVNLGSTGIFASEFCFNGYSEQTWPEEVSHLHNWLLHRMEWMDLQFSFIEPSEPVSVVHSIGKGRSSDITLCQKSGNRLYVRSTEGGKLSIYDLRGKCLVNMQVQPGERFVSLPMAMNGNMYVASLNGHKLKFRSLNN